jgi:hypothetical protein
MSDYAPITPYAAAKVINIVLASKNIEKIVTPQMMYSYAKNNRIENFKATDKKIYFVGVAFKEFLDSYVESIVNNGARRNDYDNIATQYM